VVAVTSVALGASIIEKHFTLSRENVGPDSFFSIEPEELAVLVDAVRTAEKALGEVRYGAGAEEGKNRIYRRSLFIVEDIKEGEVFTEKNLRSIRPGNGLPPKHINEVLGRKATREIKRGTSLKWDLVSK
jgi:N-acetylneuraminate synthase